MNKWKEVIKFAKSLKSNEIFGFDVDKKQFVKLPKNEQRIWKVKELSE